MKSNINFKRAVIFAFNPHNTGMYSVDLAAFRIFESLAARVDYFIPFSRVQASIIQYGQIFVNILHSSSQLENYDDIIIWGDFTTTPFYGLNDFRNHYFSCVGEVSGQESFALWHDIYLLTKLKKGKKRFFSICQNFSMIEQINLGKFRNSYEELLKRFDLIVPRDSFSSSKLTTFLGNNKNISSTMLDAAFFNIKLPNLPRKNKKREKIKIGYFFGRSDISNSTDFIQNLIKEQFDVGEINGWLLTPPNRYHETFLKKLGEIKKCELIISDTYHLIINALREGVPTIAISRIQKSQFDTVSDLKKKILMEELNLDEYYIELSEGVISDHHKNLILEKIHKIIRLDQKNSEFNLDKKISVKKNELISIIS